MSTKNFTVAFAGPGDVTTEAAGALLNDYLGFGPIDSDGYPESPDHDINLIFPVGVDHLSTGLQNVLLWSAHVDLPYTAVRNGTEAIEGQVKVLVDDAAQAIGVPNVNAKIVDLLVKAKADGDEAVLVLLWGEGEDAGDDNTEALLDIALSEGVKVVDLTAGLDDMRFSDDAVVDPDPEPEPEIVAKPRRGGRRKKAEPEPESAVAEVHTPVDEPVDEPKARRGRARHTEEPLVQEEEPLTDEIVATTVAKPARKTRKSRAKKEEPTVELTAAVIDPIVDEAIEQGLVEPATVNPCAEILEPTKAQAPVFASLDLIKGTLTSVWLYLQSEIETDALLMLDEKTEETPLAEAVREALEALEGTVGAVAGMDVVPPKRSPGRPRREAQDSDTTAWYCDGDGIIRAATRGRPRRGEDRVELTEAQVDAKREAGMVDED